MGDKLLVGKKKTNQIILAGRGEEIQERSGGEGPNQKLQKEALTRQKGVLKKKRNPVPVHKLKLRGQNQGK